MDYNNFIKNYNAFRVCAKPRAGIGIPMRFLLDKGLLYGRILDVGCGWGSDVKYLRQQGYDAYGYDKYNPKYYKPELLLEKWDVVTCQHVFSTIPGKAEHDELLGIIKDIADNTYVTVRCDKRYAGKKWEYNKEFDGYFTTLKGFCRFYNYTNIQKYFGEVEFLKKKGDYKIFKLIK